MTQPATWRARRWDVLVLGGALPGLVAAVRLARAGHRVLVAEEETAARRPALLREPFYLPGRAADGVLDACLEALGLPLIERRAFEAEPLGLQVLLPEARIDVGDARLTADEWVAWGVAAPQEAQELARRLEEAARAEGEALLAAPLLRTRRTGLPRRRRSHAPPAVPPPDRVRHFRGLPEDAAHPGPALAPLFAAQVRALCSLASAAPGPEARARLLGAPLAGGAALHRGEILLRRLLRERLEELHTEFRTVGCPFAFLRHGRHPGIARLGPDDVWLGRILVLNAPASRLAAAQRAWEQEVPSFLEGPETTHRRLVVHLRAAAEVVPESLARRAVLVSDPREPDGSRTVALSRHPSARGRPFVELVARAVVPDVPERFERVASAIEQDLRPLLPFAEGRLVRAPLGPIPQWDDEDALADPPAGRGWPGETPLAAAGGHGDVFALRREDVAALGTEGELLLGWRAGDALRDALG